MVGRRRRIRRVGGSAGTAMVETAFILPLLVFMLFGVLEFGRVFERWSFNSAKLVTLPLWAMDTPMG